MNEKTEILENIDTTEDIDKCLSMGLVLNSEAGLKQDYLIHHLVERDRLDLVKYIVSKGANIYLSNYTGRSPIFSCESYKMFEYFIRKDNSLVNIVDPWRVSPLHTFLIRHYDGIGGEGLSNEKLKEVNQAIKLSVDNNISLNNLEKIMHFVEDEEIFSMLIKCGVNFDNVKIINSVSYRNLKLLNYYGVDIIKRQNEIGINMLANFKCVNWTRLLLNLHGEYYPHKSEDLNANLLASIINNICERLHDYKDTNCDWKEVIKEFLNRGFNINSASSGYNMTPLFLATNPEVFKFLAENGADINHKNNKGEDILEYFRNRLLLKEDEINEIAKVIFEVKTKKLKQKIDKSVSSLALGERNFKPKKI